MAGRAERLEGHDWNRESTAAGGVVSRHRVERLHAPEGLQWLNGTLINGAALANVMLRKTSMAVPNRCSDMFCLAPRRPILKRDGW
jgi:hypothetical protein